MAKLDGLVTLNNPAVTVLEQILGRGYETGVFCRQGEALDLHILISSLCFFRVANRYSFPKHLRPRYDEQKAPPALPPDGRRHRGQLPDDRVTEHQARSVSGCEVRADE